MSKDLANCCVGCSGGHREAVKAYEQLETNEIPSGHGVRCGILHDPSVRNRNICRAVKRGDPVVLKLTEVALLVHPSTRRIAGGLLSFEARFREASRTKASYLGFRELAAKFGVYLPHGAPMRRRARKKLLKGALKRNPCTMRTLLFAFEYRFDPVRLSEAVERQQPSYKALVPASSESQVLAMAA